MSKKRKLPADAKSGVDEFYNASGKPRGSENVTWRDMPWTASKEAEKIAEQLERNMILNRIIMAIVEAHPRKEKKRGNEPNLNRVQQVRTALLGEAPRRGRPRQLKEELLDKIALQFFKTYFKNGMREPPLGRILKDVLVPDRREQHLTDKETENRIKRYRKAFKEEKDWLLLRATEMLDVQYTLSLTEHETTTYLLRLTGKERQSTSK